MNRNELISAKLYKGQLEILERSMGNILNDKIPTVVRSDMEWVMLDEMRKMVADLIRNVDERIAMSEAVE